MNGFRKSSGAVEIGAQAKLNLRLKVLSKGSDGYHQLETVMHRIELADTLRIELREPGARDVMCNRDVGPITRNLAYRAAVAYLDMAAWDSGFAITIQKRIPVQGGLGGGSTDAAATLLALDALNSEPLGPTVLLEIAKTLGSDVPFFTSNAVMALAHGRGDVLQPLAPLPQQFVVLVTPPYGIVTAEAYEWVDAATADSDAPDDAPLSPEQLTTWDEMRALVQNDFTPVVAKRHPLTSTIITMLLDAGATIAEMSGSGSTLYGIFPHEPDAHQLEAAIGHPVIVTRSALEPATPRMDR